MLQNLSSLRYDLQSTNEGEICSICREPLKGRKKKYILECKHIFHKECLKLACKSSDLCPLCRKDIRVERREIFGHKAGEMPGNRILKILENENNYFNRNENTIDTIRTILLDMKFPRETKFDKMHYFSQTINLYYV